MNEAKIDEDLVREAAYHLWIEEGQPHGRDQEHWHKAVNALAMPKAKTKSAGRAPAKTRETKAKASQNPESAPKPKTKSTNATKTARVKS